ncbi:MAG: type secretion system pseudopilin PulG [Betaproteobacteria bacterium]|nr:type secretion system pseudopilin PulG [Betaproteobacteria bacterium]
MVKAAFPPHTAVLLHARRARGFILIALMIFIAVMAIVAGVAIMTGAQFQRRTSEEQLIFVGGQFRNAIQSYYDTGAELPPGASRYPARLEDLLADPRSKTLKRHLRQIYPDPLTGRLDWGTVQAPGGGIMGVYSPSPAKAVKLYGFPPEFKYLEGKTKISEWQFIFIAPVLPVLPSPPAGQSPPASPPAPGAPAAPAPPVSSDLQGLLDQLNKSVPADRSAPPDNNNNNNNNNNNPQYRAIPTD